jgi:Uma2 family endonuclease
MSVQPRHDPPTYDDLKDLPPETRAEILDGEIIVTPSASPRHNDVAYELMADLNGSARPRGYKAVYDLDVLWPHSGEVTRPDVLVVTATTASSADLPVTERPVVVVEVLSPSSAGRDFVQKRRTAELAGVPEYWVVNPETHEIARHTLVDGRYDARLLEPGDEEKVDTLPFEYTLRPAVLGPLPSERP